MDDESMSAVAKDAHDKWQKMLTEQNNIYARLTWTKFVENEINKFPTILHSFNPHFRGQDISINDLLIFRLIEFDQRIDMAHIPSKHLATLRSEESEEIIFKFYLEVAKEEEQLNLMPME